MVSLFGSGTRRHLAAQDVDDTGTSDGDATGAHASNGAATAVELYDEADSVLHVLPASDPVPHDEVEASQYPMATVRPVPLQSRASTHGRAPDSTTMSSLGLPEHLLPPEGGGLAELLALLDLLPAPKLPAYRHGDEILVLTFGPHSSSAEQVVTSITTEFAAAGHPVGHATVRVEPWPSAHELTDGRATSAGTRGAGRPRSVLLRTSPDCPPSTAYRICRSVPGIRLDLWGVRTADRPAAALAWGAPVAFIDGRPARSELWAAILADRLAGGVH